MCLMTQLCPQSGVWCLLVKSRLLCFSAAGLNEDENDENEASLCLKQLFPHLFLSFSVHYNFCIMENK